MQQECAIFFLAAPLSLQPPTQVQQKLHTIQMYIAQYLQLAGFTINLDAQLSYL